VVSRLARAVRHPWGRGHRDAARAGSRGVSGPEPGRRL